MPILLSVSQCKLTALTFTCPSLVNVSQSEVDNPSYKSFVNSDNTVCFLQARPCPYQTTGMCISLTRRKP